MSSKAAALLGVSEATLLDSPSGLGVRGASGDGDSTRLTSSGALIGPSK
jgi:hypothetical protein